VTPLSPIFPPSSIVHNLLYVLLLAETVKTFQAFFLDKCIYKTYTLNYGI